MATLGLLPLVPELARERHDIGIGFSSHLVLGVAEDIHHRAPVVHALAEVVDRVVNELLAVVEFFVGLVEALAPFVDVLLDLLDLLAQTVLSLSSVARDFSFSSLLFFSFRSSMFFFSFSMLLLS